MIKQYDYNTIAQYYDLLDGSLIAYEKLTKVLLTHISTKGRNVLDLACGTGNFTNALQNEKYLVEGSDLSDEMLNVAKKKFPKINFYKKNMKLPLKKSYDIIFCMFNAIGHLNKNEFALMLKNIAPSTKIFVFDIFNFDFMKTNFITNEFIDIAKTANSLKLVRFNKNTLDVSKGIMNINQRTFIQTGFSPKKYDFSWQMQIYTEDELRKMLSNAGFTKITILGSFNNDNDAFEAFNKNKSTTMHIIAQKN